MDFRREVLEKICVLSYQWIFCFEKEYTICFGEKANGHQGWVISMTKGIMKTKRLHFKIIVMIKAIF